MWPPTCESAAPNRFGATVTHNPLSWLRFSMQVATLGVESQSVVGLRMMRLAAGGPAAEREAFRMVTEKMAAFAEAQAMLFGQAVTGVPMTGAVAPYLRRVRANRRRLSRAA